MKTKITINNGERVFELTCDKVEFNSSQPLETLKDAPCRFGIKGNLYAISDVPPLADEQAEDVMRVVNLTPSQS